MSGPAAAARFITLPWIRTGLSFSRASMIQLAYSQLRGKSIDSRPASIRRRATSASARQRGQLLA